jgi:hypothetical protein
MPWVDEQGRPVSPEEQAQADQLAAQQAAEPTWMDRLQQGAQAARDATSRAIATGLHRGPLAIPEPVANAVGDVVGGLVPTTPTEAATVAGSLLAGPAGAAVRGVPLAGRALASATRVAVPTVAGALGGLVEGDPRQGATAGFLTGLAGEAVQLPAEAVQGIRRWMANRAGSSWTRRVNEKIGEELAQGLAQEIPELAPKIGQGRPEELARLRDPAVGPAVIREINQKAERAVREAVGLYPVVLSIDANGPISTTVNGLLDRMKALGEQLAATREAARRRGAAVTPEASAALIQEQARLSDLIDAALTKAIRLKQPGAEEALKARQEAARKSRAWYDFDRLWRTTKPFQPTEEGLVWDMPKVATYVLNRADRFPESRYPWLWAALTFHDPRLGGATVQNPLVQPVPGLPRAGLRLDPGLFATMRTPRTGQSPLPVPSLPIAPDTLGTAARAGWSAYVNPALWTAPVPPVPPPSLREASQP